MSTALFTGDKAGDVYWENLEESLHSEDIYGELQAGQILYCYPRYLHWVSCRSKVINHLAWHEIIRCNERTGRTESFRRYEVEATTLLWMDHNFPFGDGA